MSASVSSRSSRSSRSPGPARTVLLVAVGALLIYVT